MYNNNDIQKMIQDVNSNRDTFNPFMDGMSASDWMAISFVLADGFCEAFDRYDSDVCEQFITAYEKWHSKGYGTL